MTVSNYHIVMPVKDAIDVAEEAIRAVLRTGEPLTVWNDRSTPENTERLCRLQQQLGFSLIHASDLTDNPSPNYRLLLITEQQKALADKAHLLIVESDVMVGNDTFARLQQAATEGVGMVAAVTVDRRGNINYPYEYARKTAAEGQNALHTTKHLSFCCTLLTHALLEACPFNQLDAGKDWFDVTVSHKSLQAGLQNLLLLDTPVLHLPHSSRPWKQLKYTHPLRYYSHKLIHRSDRI